MREHRKFIEVEDEAEKLAKAYSNLTGTAKKTPQQKYKLPQKGGEGMNGVKSEGSSSKDKRQRRKTDRLSPTWNSEDEDGEVCKQPGQAAQSFQSGLFFVAVTRN